MKFRLIYALAFLLLAACSSPKPVTGDYPDQVSYYNASEGVAAQGGSGVGLKVLNPGGKKEINQNLKINVVFLGYQQGATATNVNTASFLAGLPGSYRTIARIPSFYNQLLGKPNEDLGINFSYSYNLKFAGKKFEDAFFGYLSSIAVQKPLTVFQANYNAQAIRSKTIDKNYWIDAVKTEQWLAKNLGQIGINEQQYTIVLVNWYGRPDFKYHAYTKTNEPDSDTGYNFGEIRDSRKMIAWGGTAYNDKEDGNGQEARVWFHDLSAGPESWTGNWDLVNADVDGDGAADYRMPPVWEYGNTAGYRPFTDLSGDLAKITRYVAINLLFTASPIYRAALTPPHQPRRIKTDFIYYQGDPSFDATTYFKAAEMERAWGNLQNLNTFQASVKGLPLTGEALSTYQCYVLNAPGAPCTFSGGTVPSFASIFAYNLVTHLQSMLDGTGKKFDYVVPGFVYNVDASLPIPYLGLADDSYLNDGTQGFVFGALNPEARNLGFGITTTLIHEVGHHLAMSHPHDGYDYQANIDYGPSGDFYYAWVGDESSTIMQYIALENEFSQFDYDNMNRYLTSTFINQANAILKKIAAHPRSGRVAGKVLQADDFAGAALRAYSSMKYEQAVSLAEKAYDQVLSASETLNIGLDPYLWYTAYGINPPNPAPFNLKKLQELSGKKIKGDFSHLQDNNPKYEKKRFEQQ